MNINHHYRNKCQKNATSENYIANTAGSLNFGVFCCYFSPAFLTRDDMAKDWDKIWNSK